VSVGRTVKVTLPPDVLDRALAYAPAHGPGPHQGERTLATLLHALVPVLDQMARDLGTTPAELLPWLHRQRAAARR
jgi:hypothetical protein